jgi:hypothetical protein
MPRPRKQPAERRDARLPAPRLTAAELAFVAEQADAAGLDMAEFVRRRVLGRKVAPAQSLTDSRMVHEVNRVGVLLNQIARAMNSDRPERLDLADTLQDTRAVLSMVLAHGA